MRRIKSGARLPPYLMFPHFLLEMELPANATLVYLLLLDRTRLSLSRQGWTDLMGDVFIYYPLEELAKTLRCSVRSVTTALLELSNKGLIERVRQGVGRANVIYVCLPEEPEDDRAQVSSNPDGRNLPTGLEETFHPDWKESSNHMGRYLPGSKNYRERSTEQQLRSKAVRAPYGRFRNILLSEKEYRRLSQEVPRLDELMEEMSCYIASSGKSYKNYEAALRAWARKDRRSGAARSYVRREGESL